MAAPTRCSPRRDKRGFVPIRFAGVSAAGSTLIVVGHTPLVRLNRIVDNPRAQILAKIEGRDPAYSVKCRIGAAIGWGQPGAEPELGTSRDRTASLGRHDRARPLRGVDVDIDPFGQTLGLLLRDVDEPVVAERLRDRAIEHER